MAYSPTKPIRKEHNMTIVCKECGEYDCTSQECIDEWNAFVERANSHRYFPISTESNGYGWE